MTYFTNLIVQFSIINQKKIRQILLSIDFTKDFDNVNIDKLIKILTKPNTDKTIINWLKQFLFNRKIIFKKNDNKIEIITSTGLPQGSVLSPLLFNIYTAELHKAHNENIQISQYADNFSLLIYAKQLRSLKKWIRIAVEKFTKTATKLELPINTEKSKFIELFKRNKKIHSIAHNNSTFNRTTDLTILGVIFDDKLNFNKHHKNLKEKTNKDINLIKTISALNHGIHPYKALTILKATIKSN